MFFSCNIRQLWQTIGSLPVLVALSMTLLLTGVSTPVPAVNELGLFELDVRDGVEGDQDKQNDPIPLFVGDGNTTDDDGIGGPRSTFLRFSSAYKLTGFPGS